MEVSAREVHANLASFLDAQPELEGAAWSVVVADGRGQILFDRNGGTRLIPASNQKLLPTAYALHHLGAEWRPETLIWDAEDAVYVQSSGDPSLSTVQLREIGKKLRNRLRPVIVRQAFRPGIPPGWEYDDLPNRYAAAVTAFTVDQGAFRLQSDRGRLIPLPSELGIQVFLESAPGPVRVEYDRLLGKVHVRGRLSSTAANLDTLALPHPDRSAARFLGTELRHADATTAWPSTPPTFRIPGSPMGELVRGCLQPSDNHFAEQILLMTAVQRGKIQTPAQPYAAATADLRAFLTDVVGIPASEVRPADGSGLSRHNLITARALIRLLAWSDQQPWRQVYRDGMARTGVGTLRNRLTGSRFMGKTGTLNSVVGLSGYVVTANGEGRIVSILVNNTVESSAKVREIVDQVVRFVESNHPFGPPDALR